jgi:hypothetical protein
MDRSGRWCGGRAEGVNPSRQRVRRGGVYVEPSFVAINRYSLTTYMEGSSDSRPTLFRTAKSSRRALASCPGSQADLGSLNETRCS